MTPDGRACIPRSWWRQPVDPQQQLVFCQICREYSPCPQTFKLSECGHRFCRDCLEGFLACRIREGQVFPTCFHW